MLGGEEKNFTSESVWLKVDSEKVKQRIGAIANHLDGVIRDAVDDKVKDIIRELDHKEKNR